MREFTQLVVTLDQTNSTNEKIEAITQYLLSSSDESRVFGVAVLLGAIKKRTITSRTLRECYLQSSSLPQWLFEECYSHVGDTAETVGLLAVKGDQSCEWSLQSIFEESLPRWGSLPASDLAAELNAFWQSYDVTSAFVLHKILTGGWRIGVSQKTVVKALAKAFEVDESVLTYRLTGGYKPTVDHFQKLISQSDFEKSPSQAYPFYLASPLENESVVSGDIQQWIFEWKYDGIRLQIIKREKQVFLWSRGEELINNSFPEVAEAASHLPDGCVLDAELVIWRDDRVAPFADLQKRLGRKKPSQKMISDYPAMAIVFDCLEYNDEDIRQKPLIERKGMGREVLSQSPLSQNRLREAETLLVNDWDHASQLRNSARESLVEGLMIKHAASVYKDGRKRGEWWKYKIEPFTLDAVLIYAQAGSGRRANLFTDYTFAIWKGEELVPFAKAYSGLNQKEIEELDRWIRQNTKEKFGPTRSVKAEHVFEIAFEGIMESKRHKSGIAVRFPRIRRWRKDKPIAQANRWEDANALLSQYG